MAYAEDFGVDKDISASDDVDQQYFDSYGQDLTVTKIMLQDAPRMEYFLSALSPAVVEGKTILDCGAGTGVLSLICARNGARHVVSLEAAPEMVARIPLASGNNKLGAVVTAVNVDVDKIESLERDVLSHAPRIESNQGIDILVSEWMGFYLFHEGMLRSVLHLRDICTQHNKAIGYRPSNIYNNTERNEADTEDDRAFSPQCIPAEGTLLGCPVDLSVDTSSGEGEVPPFVEYIKQRDFSFTTPQNERLLGQQYPLTPNSNWGNVNNLDFSVYAQMEAESLINSVRERLTEEAHSNHKRQQQQHQHCINNSMLVHVIPPSCCITSARPLMSDGNAVRFNFEQMASSDLDQIQGSVTYQAEDLVYAESIQGQSSKRLENLSGFCISWDVFSYQYSQKKSTTDRKHNFAEQHTLTTSPFAHPTHWKQATVMLPEDLPLSVFASSILSDNQSRSESERAHGDESSDYDEDAVESDAESACTGTVTVTLTLTKDDVVEGDSNAAGRTYVVEMELSD